METDISPEIRETAITSFENELSELEKEKQISQFVGIEFPHGILPPTRVIRNLVAMNWYQSKSKGRGIHAVA